MIYTVTLNPALDKTVVIPSFRIGAVNRIADMQVDPGGKGINVSKVIQALGGESCAYAALGGDSGEQLLHLLRDCGFSVEVIPAEGPTRTNLKVVDPELHTNTDINEPGSRISKEALRNFTEQLGSQLRPGDILVLSGSVPKDVEKQIYGELTSLCQRFGARAFVDAEGELLANALVEKPFLVKPNIHELSGLVGRELKEADEVCEAARELLQKGVHVVVVSMGGDGALMCWENQAVYAKAPEVSVASTVGAGDSMVAALAYGMSCGMEITECFRLAVAAGTAAVTLSGTQAPNKKLVEEIREAVTLTAW